MTKDRYCVTARVSASLLIMIKIILTHKMVHSDAKIILFIPYSKTPEAQHFHIIYAYNVSGTDFSYFRILS